MMNLGIFELIPPDSDLSPCISLFAEHYCCISATASQGLSKTFAASHLRFHEGYLLGIGAFRSITHHFRPNQVRENHVL